MVFEALWLFLPLTGHVVHQRLHLDQLLLQNLDILNARSLQLRGREKKHYVLKKKKKGPGHNKSSKRQKLYEIHQACTL